MIIAIVIGVSVLAALIFVCILMSWRRVVPTNQVHVVQRRKSSKAYGRDYGDGNVYYEIPSFIPFLGVEVMKIPINVFEITLMKYQAYDVKKVPFRVEVKSFFQIEDAVVASRRVNSFQELNTQLTDTLQGVVRKVLASYPVDNIMVDRKALGEEFKKEIADQTHNWGVKANYVEFMDIEDADGTSVITDIMNKERTTIEKESRIQVATNKKLAKMAELEAEQAVGERDIEKNRKLQVNAQEASQTVKEAEALTKTKEMAVLEIDTVRRQEIAKQQAEIEAEAKAEAMRREAEGFSASQQSEGEGEASKIRNVGDAEAAVIKAKGLAAAEAKDKEASALQKFNEAATGIEKLRVTESVMKAKWEAIGLALSKADLKLVQSGRGANLFGIDMNAETGADLKTALDQLGLDIPAVVDKVKELVGKK